MTYIYDSSTDRPYKTYKTVFTARDKNVRLPARSFLQEAFLAPRFQRGVYQQFKNNRLSTRDRPNGLARRLTAE